MSSDWTDGDVSGSSTLTDSDHLFPSHINELRVETDAREADLTTHGALTIGHGATGAIVGTTNTQTLTNKTLTSATLTSPTLTSAVLNTAVSGTAVLDEDNMASNSATKVSTQQSIKAYVDAHAADTTTHGVTGNVVGISDTQNLSNKTFTDQTEFSEDINLATGKNIQVNDADPWRTIDIFGSMSPASTLPCSDMTTIEAGTNDIDYKVLDFATGADEVAFVNFRMPDSYDAGPVQFRYTWTNAGGGAAETVVFELSGIAYTEDDPIDAAVGTAIEVEDTWIAQGDIHYSAWSGDVTLAGTPAAGEYVHFEIMRDVSQDDLTGDARLMNVQIRYKQKQYSD